MVTYIHIQIVLNRPVGLFAPFSSIFYGFTIEKQEQIRSAVSNKQIKLKTIKGLLLAATVGACKTTITLGWQAACLRDLLLRSATVSRSDAYMYMDGLESGPLQL